MKQLKIYCKNCKGHGIINHPQKMFCPFCNGVGYKDIEYKLNSQIKPNKNNG